MNHTEYAFDAQFQMFTPAGLRISFQVAADTAEAHLKELRAYLGQLDHAGFSINIPGVEDGEKLEAIDGWVLGETSKGEPCAYLYSATHGLQWKVATVYVEKMGDLPFDTSKGKLWPGDSAPTRETAETKKYMVTVPEFKIVMAATGKMTESGNPIYRYARIFGSDAKPAADAISLDGEELEALDPNGGPPDADDDNPFEDVDTSARPNWSGPPEAQRWAVEVGACANEHEARNSFKKIVMNDFGGSLTPDNMGEVLDAFFAHQVKKMQEVAA